MVPSIFTFDSRQASKYNQGTNMAYSGALDETEKEMINFILSGSS